MSQTRTDINMQPFLIEGGHLVEEDGVIIQDAQRATPLVFGTLMAQIAATRKWTPFINEAAVDGSGIPRGVYIGPDILAATIMAGDVNNSMIATKGDPTAIYDTAQLVIENSKTLNTVIGAGTIHAKTVKQALLERGLVFKTTVETDAFENT